MAMQLAYYGEAQRIGTVGKAAFHRAGFTQSRKGAKAQNRRGERKMVERNMNEKDTRGERFRVMACVLGFASLLVSFFRIPSSAEFSFLPTVFFLFLFAPLRLCVKTILGRLCPGDTSRSCGGSST
jgi:hypothetical protein